MMGLSGCPCSAAIARLGTPRQIDISSRTCARHRTLAAARSCFSLAAATGPPDEQDAIVGEIQNNAANRS